MTLVAILVSVAFLTLMERKLMGLMHYRKGPSKVTIYGLSQPLSDAMKLFTKENVKTSMSKQMMMNAGPILSIFLMMMTWSFYEFSFNILSCSMKILMLFSILGLNIYSMMMMSWGSNSKYAIMGGHRVISQALSYEVCLLTVIMIASFMWFSYNSNSLMVVQQGAWLSVVIPPLSWYWVMLYLAEANRTPFDTAEGESEIVSGFNIEYGGGMFSLIFISEYGMLILLSFITNLYFMGGNYSAVKISFVVLIFIWVRCSFPRVRYDTLMMYSWKIMLPFIVSTMAVMFMAYSI